MGGPFRAAPHAWHERADWIRADGIAWLLEVTRSRWCIPAFANFAAVAADDLLAMRCCATRLSPATPPAVRL